MPPEMSADQPTAVEARLIYSNSVSVTTAPYDTTIRFINETREAGPMEEAGGLESQSVHIADVTFVKMSPQLAKSLATILLDHVASYERKHDTLLPLPDHLQEKWDRLMGEVDDE